jgi:ribonuclease E
MAKKMLIDATHPEESRVAIIDGNRLEDYEAETSTKQQFKGNIYLAKVIRVEPSLQAAFVEYGQDRHGFLPFAEIHPDYYRIPVEDRRALETATAQAASEISEKPVSHSGSDNPDSESIPDSALDSEKAENLGGPLPEGTEDAPTTELLVDENADDEEFIRARRPKPCAYKIQEVIKRNQIMLVQVIKEERGNKGAALTTYLSIPGRYCVLMPNAGHRSGGISRKIADVTVRKRLRDILNELPIPESMSLIVRTAGQDRNKLEIRRDFDYLIRLWSDIRQKTLESIAPELIYAEGDIIKRSIRDTYGKDINEIWVDGEEGYKIARAIMKTLTPSHIKKVKEHKDEISLFQKFHVDSLIDAIMTPVAPLPSGGSIVINQTEALVAIDVNSGKATKERHIDETALKTNLEAAEEIARQLKLRDLGGLIVIDFIDMGDPKHSQQVEKQVREAVKSDRARIQLGRISQFGLLELSRQRLRPSILESNMKPCPHCQGTGMVRSIESMALLILRSVEAAGVAGKSASLLVTVPADIDLYLLNQKRRHILDLEQRYGLSIFVQRNPALVAPDFKIETLIPKSNASKLVTGEKKEILEEEAPPKAKEEAHPPHERDRNRRNPFQRRRHKNGDHKEGHNGDRKEGHNGDRKEGHNGDRKEGQRNSQTETQDNIGPENPEIPTGPNESGEKKASRSRNRRRRRGRKSEQLQEGMGGIPETRIENEVKGPVSASEVPSDRDPSAEKSGRRRRRGRKPGQLQEGMGGTPETRIENEVKGPVSASEAPSDRDPSAEKSGRRRRRGRKPEQPPQETGNASKTGDDRSPKEHPAPETRASDLETSIGQSSEKPGQRRRRPRQSGEKSTTEKAPDVPVKSESKSPPKDAVVKLVHPEKDGEAPKPEGKAPEGGKRRRGFWRRLLDT